MDEKEILYIALGNSYIMYNEALEELKNEGSEAEITLLKYIIKRHEELMDKYAEDINQSDDKIQRPTW
jgi:multimeric flavodoxin WrbA